MQKFRTLSTSHLAVFIGGAVLALLVAWPLRGAAQDQSSKTKDANLHAQHTGKEKLPAGDQDLASQIAELRDSVARLEAALAKGQPDMTSGMGGMAGMGKANADQPGADAAIGQGMPMSGKDAMTADKTPTQGGMAAMGSMASGNPPSGGAMQSVSGMGGMGNGASPPAGQMGMMGMKMDKMMGMMEMMMGGMGGGGGAKSADPPMGGMGSSKPTSAPMGGAAPGGGMMDMDMDKKEMGGMGAGSPATGAPMAGGGMGMMGMDKMEMAGMMGMMSGMAAKGGSSMATVSALPGFPGASHLYHIGATSFFLDHPQHIVLTTEQQMMLNQARVQTALDKASTDRSVEEAEQALWMLTAADQPDNAQIEAKVAEIEKLKGDARLRFIGAIGRAATILNDEQRNVLTGFAPPVSAAPAAAPMAGGMTDM